MDARKYLIDFIYRLKPIFDTHKTHFECFDEYAIQVEYWLKGELTERLHHDKTIKLIENFALEVGGHPDLKKKKVDCLIQLNDCDIWIELKHWQIGYQGPNRWKSSNYFGSKGIGVYHDIEKLSNIKEAEKYVIILATKNPEYDEPGDWEKGIERFNNKFTPLNIISHTKPTDFPKQYFLGLLEVKS